MAAHLTPAVMRGAVEQLFSLHERGHRDFALSLDKLAIPDTKARVCAESVGARITA